MILMLAPAANMNFASLPSGSTYTSDANGLIRITNNSVADQLALAAAGCQTLTPFAGGTANQQPGAAYTVQSTDENDFILFTSGSTVTATLPNNLPQGFVTELFQIGAGQVTAAAASGATINTPNLASTPLQYSSLLCLVTSNTTGTNAAWVVISQPAQSGSGLIGATTLNQLYSQDTATHYAQYTTSQVFQDATTFTGSVSGSVLTVSSISGAIGIQEYISGAGIPAGTYVTSFATGTGGNGTYNISTSPGTITAEAMTAAGNGTWLKTGGGNGAGNWQQVSAVTVTGVNAALATEITRATVQENLIRNAPQQPLKVANAVRRRFAAISDEAATEGDRRSFNAWGVRSFRSNLVYNDNVYQTFGEPQALLLSDPNAAGGSGDPIGGYFISVADLAAAGIVPGSGQYISAQIAIDIGSAVDQTLDQVANSANGQCALILRYGGPGATQELYYELVANDVTFFNALTAPSYPAGATTDSQWVGVFTSSMITTGYTKGYAWNNVHLPATYGGFALTGILLLAIGHATTSAQVSSIQVYLASVISGTSIVAAQAYFNPEDRPASFVPKAHVVNTLDVASADRIIMLGDSLGNGEVQPINKAWICKASLFSDWNWENFSESGDTLQIELNRIFTENFPFGQVSFRDYRGSRVFISSEGNDANWETPAQYVNDLKMAIRVCRDFGAQPTIFPSYFATNFPYGTQTLLRNVAEQEGVDYIDVKRHAKLFSPASQNGAEFYNLHPGVRSNELIFDPIDKYLEGVDGPRRSFKVFRKRPAVSAGSSPYDALMFESFFDRAVLFEEINVGHAAMLTGVQHCDALTAQASNWTYGVVRSEYIQLMSGFPVTFADFGLIEATFPETPDEIRLVLNDANISVFVKDVMATAYPVTGNRYQAFTPSGSPSVTAGATYTDGTNFPGVTLFYIGTWNSQLMFSAGTGTQPYAGVVAKTNVGSGTLTKTGGTGDPTIGYNSSNIGFDQAYYACYGQAPGHWTALTGTNGVFQLSSYDLRGKVRRNKISFLLYESGGFYLSAPRIMYRSSRDRNVEPRKTFAVGQEYYRPARGVELLGHNYTSSLTGWTVVGSLTPAAPADAQMPQDPATGSAMVNCVTIDTSDYLQQAFTWTPSYETDLEVEVTIYARNFPALADPSSITQDTFDFLQLEVDIVTNAGLTCPRMKRVGLWWDELKFRTILPLGDSAATLVIKPVSGSTIQIAFASVKLLNT